MTITKYFVSMTWLKDSNHIAVEKNSRFYQDGIDSWNKALISVDFQYECRGVKVSVHSYVSTFDPVLSRYFKVEGEKENIEAWARFYGFTMEEQDEENRP